MLTAVVMLNSELDPEDRRRAQRAIGSGFDDQPASSQRSSPRGRSADLVVTLDIAAGSAPTSTD
jgi:hypothetical protein